MSRKTSGISRNVFIVSSFLQARNRIDEDLIERCSVLTSLRKNSLVTLHAKQIINPIGKLYATIATHGYSKPDLFTIEGVPDYYKARVILSIAISLRLNGQLSIATKLFSEALKLAIKWDDPLTHNQARRELAIIHSLNGDSKGAVLSLEAAYPAVRELRFRRPAYYFGYLNSLAVEYMEVGRLEEASGAITVALKSPFLARYPEIIETASDIRAKLLETASHSFTPVGIDVRLLNVLSGPFAPLPFPLVIDAEHMQQSAPVTKITDWKGPMAKTSKNQPTGKPEFDDDPASLKERAILHRDIADPHMTKEELLQVIEFVNKLKEKKSGQK